MLAEAYSFLGVYTHSIYILYIHLYIFCSNFVLIFWAELVIISLFIHLISLSATRSLHKASSDTHAPSKIAAWAYLRSLIVQSFIVFALIHQTFTCRIMHRAGWTGREKVWVISFQCAQVTSYYPQDSARPLLSHDRFPAMIMSQYRAGEEVWMLLGVRPKSAVEPINLHALITHQLWVECTQIYMC